MAASLAEYTDHQLQNARALEFTRLVCALKSSNDSGPRSLSDSLALANAAERVMQRWPHTISQSHFQKAINFEVVTKAGVAPGTTDTNWGSLAAIQPLIDSFVSLSRAASVVGRLQAGGAVPVPFNTSVPTVTSGGTYRWTSQAGPKPVGQMSLQSTTLPITKAAGIIVIAAELVKLATPTAEQLVRRELVEGLAAYLDQQFADRLSQRSPTSTPRRSRTPHHRSARVTRRVM